MNRWRDNGQAYALGLAVLSFPITIALLKDVPPSWIVVPVGLAGSLGMYLGGRGAYALTRMCGSIVIRAMLMTPIATGIALIVGSAPFALLWFVGMFIAWTVGAPIVTLPLAGVVLAWSALYLALSGRPVSRATFHDEERPYLTALLCGIPGFAAVGLALWKL